MIPVAIETPHPDLMLGVVESHSVRLGPADPDLNEQIGAALAANSINRPTCG